ncbi:MAG TPA: ABC transporter substrate-binding protein, partial [Chloroflexota bacterium]
GPFRFVCQNTSSGQTSFYSAGQTPQYALKPNPYYYGAKPKVQLQLPAISLIDTNYREYLAGNVDTSFVPTPFLSKWINKSSEYLGYPTSIVTYLTPNTKSPPFSDVHCRLAVAYGIDRQTIVNRILHGSVRADYVVLPYGYLGYYNGSKSEPHYDPQIARRELSRCAYRLQPVSLTFPNTSSDATNTYTAIASMLNQIGFNVTPKAVTANDWVSVVSEPLSKSNTQIVRNGWQQDYPDPQDYAGLLLHTGAQNNIGGWSNASYDRLVDRAALESNRAQRAALYRQAQHIALSQGAWISLFNTVGHQLVKPYVHGLVGTSAYGDLVPRNYDWSQVSISKH